MIKKLFIFVFAIIFVGCSSNSNVRIDYAGKTVKAFNDNLTMTPVNNQLFKIESKNEYVVHLPNNNDWNFIFNDGKSIFTAQSNTFGFNVSLFKFKGTEANASQEKYLANIGQNYINGGLKLNNSRMVIVEPSNNRVLSFSHSMLEGHFKSWFFYTMRQSKKNNEIYYLEVRKVNPPPEHLDELIFALNNLLANTFYLID